MASGTSATSYTYQRYRTTQEKQKQNTLLTDNKVQRGFGASPDTASAHILDGAAGLDTHRGVVLPPGDGAPLGFYEPLLEDVVEDVLEVEEVGGVADIDELGSDLLVCAGRLVVSDPELGSLGLRALDLMDLRAVG
jgi:hypothetical protein